VGAIAIVAWSIVSFFVIRGGVNDANERIGGAALAALSEAPGSALTTPQTILFLGVDTGGARTDTGRADSIVLMRTDPDSHQISLLSVPRDFRVEIPGHGLDKINAAYALGGTALMIETVENLTRTPIHHAALIDFDSFPEVIDAVGGVAIDVPAPIVSNRFDCPFPSKLRCESWDGWKFAPVTQTMDGKRALIYSRVRENRLDESESDITRGARQQAVIRAIVDQLVSLRTFARLPFVGRDVTRPLTTDLTTSELFELAWVTARAQNDNMVQCRLGGTPSSVNGVSYLVGTARNPVVVNMFLGRATPRKPQGSGGRFAPGCPITGAEPAAKNKPG
jgi:LCP family protein required for cell wall assembly